MNKKLKYVLASVMAGAGFYFFLGLPYETRYYGLLVAVVLVCFCLWFGLGIVLETNLQTRLMSIIMPVLFFGGLGLFTALLSLDFWGKLVFSVFLGLCFYFLFLVENVYLVSIGFKTVPLYRAAYTVSLIILFLTGFFVFNSLFSFGLSFWFNALVVFVLSALIFVYQFWAIAIELPDDGQKKNFWAFVLIPALLVAQLAVVLCFWPVGIFKQSIYLVLAIYILSGLIQAEVRDRLFKRIWLMFVWVGVAVVVGIILMTNWRGF